MNACSHACQAAADDGYVTPGYRSLLVVRAYLLNDFDPFVSRAPGRALTSEFSKPPFFPAHVTAYRGMRVGRQPQFALE
jgi:hypothetical protein